MIVHMIGNAHIDPVWLWGWQAGVDEALATVRSAVDRCHEYPEFIFTRGEAWVYKQIQQIDPDLFEEVRALVRSGQWHVTGGQWIQPDVNLPTYEGLRRQIVHGTRYFQEHFDVAPNVGYNVDSFGHPATLPDLLASFNYIGYVFHRPNPDQMKLHGCTFRWRGAGGAEVMGFRIPAAYTTRADDLYGQIMLSLDAADEAVGHVMCFYGVGNHGGGPTKGNIEYILANKHAFNGAELQFSTPERFFLAAREKWERLPIVDTELQRTFPGCYVVMQDIKREQRHGEHRLMQARDVITQWSDEVERQPLTSRIDRAWEDLLFTEFHDILAGTSVGSAWDSVRAIQGRARIEAEEVIVNVTRRWARRHLPRINHQQIATLNPEPIAFDGFIAHEPFLDFDPWGKRWLADADGNPVPYQIIRPENAVMPSAAILFPLKIGARSATTLVIRDDAKPAPLAIENAVEATPYLIANKDVQVSLDPNGIRQITVGGKAVLGADGLRLAWRADVADTWVFHADRFVGALRETTSNLQWIVEESGPLRARVRADAVLGQSRIRWTIALYHDRPEVEIGLEVIVAEQFKLLQMLIDLADRPQSWRCGLAGGAVTREPSPSEYPLQGWARTVHSTAAPIAMVTQDANSASLDDNMWAWSLLRSSRMAWGGGKTDSPADRIVYTDQGVHQFQFVLVPGSNDDAGCDARALRLVRKPIIMDRYEGMNRPPWGNNPARNLWTPSEHRARKDGRMSHLVDAGEKGVEEK